ncbi:hypothetical protein G5C60_48865 [Streptomyces sp. HC44]|uniref:Lipoprotein CseA n=1 Tax=Streptomyces scabichelini TaxID=2711217 RepID=A0A6G4VM93_9ACTN|nr:hypothetical protein [Streptomyces scabichelini]NGO15292.1 hypothetical protein [Streptomyces scabichelini]
MRGLDTGPGTGAPQARGALKAAITAVAVLAALGLLVSACATGGTGARDEGPARSDSVSVGAATPSASPSGAAPRVDAVRLLKDDPKVSTAIKRDLKPCVADEYPVDVSYGNLTGGSANDVVINVLTCGDAVGVGSYVYREQGDEYENVFKAEEPPVYAEIDRGDLVITQQVYEKGDSVTLPSGEEVITYRWTAGRFSEQDRTHNDYSKVVGGETPTPSE